MEDFESRLAELRLILQRYVRYCLRDSSDADDVFQEVCLLAFLKQGQLRNPEAFKPWILSIARNRCMEYYRKKGKQREISLEELKEAPLLYGRHGWTVQSAVEDTLELLSSQDREVLKLYFWEELPQAEIAKRLGIPVGTVKSRLHNAKARFRENYPYPPGGNIMTKLPKKMPHYTIEWTEETPFSCRWEELQGWLLVPRMGEKLSWGLYEAPSGKRTEYTDMEVLGKAEVHGIEGVEFSAIQYGAEDYYRTGCIDKIERRFIAQLTDTHSRYLAESHVEDGIRKCYTFLDGESFLNNWGFGPDNIGNEINIRPKGLIQREGKVITSSATEETVDVAGRCWVTICGKRYDTICVMDVCCFNDAVVSEQYIDKNGRTILWRRFNRDDWAMERFGGQRWSEKLPDNEQLLINGETYVHWYDCFSTYVDSQ